MAISWNTVAPKVVTAAGLLVIIAALHLGQSLVMPVAFAILLSMILAPLAGFGERMRLPRVLSAVTVVALAFGALGLAGLLVAGEATTLASKAPEYRTNFLQKVEELRKPSARKLQQLQDSVTQVQTAVSPANEVAPAKAPQDPVKVEVVENPLSPLKIATAVVGSLVTAMGYLSVVILLCVFFLIYRTEILDRVIWLAGDAQVNMTTQTIAEATRGVSRFLGLQTLVNASHGVIVGLILLVMGVPGALLCGFLAAVLRFVPYVGPVVGSALPVLLSIAVFPGWTKPLLLLAILVGWEIVLNNVVEPLVYGKRTGISPLAVVLAAIFWAWLWGGAGLILAVPLTVCLVTLGKYAPSLRFLSVALSDQPDLDPKLQIYHRLLGPHPVEAAVLLERELADGQSLAGLYDEVVLPVLRMIETDVQQDKLDGERASLVIATLREIVDELAQSVRQPMKKRSPYQATVLCLPAATKADALSAHMLTQILELQGCPASSVEVENMAGETMDAVEAEGAGLLVISISPPSNLLRARYLYKRLRRRFGEIPIVAGVWGGMDSRTLESRIAPDGNATLVASFANAEKVVADLLWEVSVRNRLGSA